MDTDEVKRNYNPTKKRSGSVGNSLGFRNTRLTNNQRRPVTTVNQLLAHNRINNPPMPSRYGRFKRTKRYKSRPSKIRRTRKRGTKFGRRRRYGRKQRFGRRRGNKSSFRKAIISAIAPVDVYSKQTGDCFIVNGSTTAGWTCGYRTMSNNTLTNDPVGVQDPGVMTTIAGIIVARLALSPPYSIAFQLQSGQIVHRMTNDSNRTIQIIGYKCRCRKDLPNISPFNSTTDSMLTILGRGFSDSGVDATVRGATNAGLLRTDLSPYNSSLFTQLFKIVKKRRVHLMPGRDTKFVVSIKRPQTIRVNRYLDMPLSTTSYSTATFVINWVKGETFWIWKLFQENITNNNADTLNVAGTTIRVNMLTTTHINYKYINNLLPTISTGTISNIANAGTVNVMPQYIASTASITAANT